MTLTTIEFDRGRRRQLRRQGGWAGRAAPSRTRRSRSGFVIADASAQVGFDAVTERFSGCRPPARLPWPSGPRRSGRTETTSPSPASTTPCSVSTPSMTSPRPCASAPPPSIPGERVVLQRDKLAATMHLVVQQMVDARAAGRGVHRGSGNRPTRPHGDRRHRRTRRSARRRVRHRPTTSSSTPTATPPCARSATVPVLSPTEIADDPVRRAARRAALGQADGSRVGDRPLRHTVVAAGPADHHPAR